MKAMRQGERKPKCESKHMQCKLNEGGSRTTAAALALALAATTTLTVKEITLQMVHNLYYYHANVSLLIFRTDGN